MNNEDSDKTTTPDEVNDGDNDIEPAEDINGDNNPTVGHPDSINEIESPTTPTDDNLSQQPPTMKPMYKYKRPALIVLMNSHIVKTTPRAKPTLGRTTLRRTTQRITRPQSMVETEPCNPNPCQHNSTCEQFDTDSNYSCKCPDGYSGAHCTGKWSTDRWGHISNIFYLRLFHLNNLFLYAGIFERY